MQQKKKRARWNELSSRSASPEQSDPSPDSPEPVRKKKRKQLFSRLIFAKLVFALHQSGQSGTSPEPVRKLIGSRQFLSRGTTKKVACFRYMMINPLESNDIHGIHGSKCPVSNQQSRCPLLLLRVGPAMTYKN